MRWSYKTVHFELKKEGLLGSAFLDVAEIELVLNRYGQGGWELVSVVETGDGLVGILKQPIGLESIAKEPQAASGTAAVQVVRPAPGRDTEREAGEPVPQDAEPSARRKVAESESFVAGQEQGQPEPPAGLQVHRFTPVVRDVTAPADTIERDQFLEQQVSTGADAPGNKDRKADTYPGPDELSGSERDDGDGDDTGVGAIRIE